MQTRTRNLLVWAGIALAVILVYAKLYAIRRAQKIRESESVADASSPEPVVPRVYSGPTAGSSGLTTVPDAPTPSSDVPPDDTPTDGRAFTIDANKHLKGIRVFQQAPPPKTANDTDNPPYPHFPCTDSVTQQDFTKSPSDMRKMFFLWIPRRNIYETTEPGPNKKPNPIFGHNLSATKQGAIFTTLEKANAAAISQLRQTLGLPYQTPEFPNQDDYIPLAEFRKDPAAYCTTPYDGEGGWNNTGGWRVMVDKVVLPPQSSKAKDFTGVLFDYEPGDYRTANDTLKLVRKLADMVAAAGFDSFFYTNPLTSGTLRKHGLTSNNLPYILDSCDYMGIAVGKTIPEPSISEGYKNSIDRLGSAIDYDKIVLVFELGIPGNPSGETTLADAKWVYDKLHEPGNKHPDKVMFWRYGADPEAGPTDLSKQKQAIVCFGQTTQPTAGQPT